MFDKLFGWLGYYPFNRTVINGYKATTTDSDITVNANTVWVQTTLYACVKIIAETIASLPIDIKTQTPNGPVTDNNNPYAALLKRTPNQFQSPFDFFSVMVANELIYGNAYALIERDGGVTPKRLTILNSEQVDPIVLTKNQLRASGLPDETDKLYYKVREGEHKGSYPAEDVIHFRGMTTDYVEGVSAVTVAAEAVGLAIAAEKFGAKFFGNGALIGGFLTFDKPLREEQRIQYAAQSQAQLQGLDAAHKIGVLANGEDFKQIGHSPQESQYIELRKIQVEEISRVFVIPTHLLNYSGGTTSYGSIEQENQRFDTYNIRPRAEKYEAELNRKLFPNQPQTSVSYNMDALRRGDMSTRGEFYSKLIQLGVYNRDEIRSKEGDPSIANGYGKDYLTMANLITDEQRKNNQITNG